MRFAESFLMSIGAVALASVLVNVISPQAVHAAVAALVQVNNPATSPALVSDVDNPARSPFQARLCVNECTPSSPFPTSVTVPIGKTLVIEQIAGECFPGLDGEGTIAVGLTVNNGLNTVTHLFGLQQNGVGITLYTNHTTRLYAAGGTSVLPANNSLLSPSNCDIAFSGYLITP